MLALFCLLLFTPGPQSHPQGFAPRADPRMILDGRVDRRSPAEKAAERQTRRLHEQLRAALTNRGLRPSTDELMLIGAVWHATTRDAFLRDGQARSKLLDALAKLRAGVSPSILQAIGEIEVTELTADAGPPVPADQEPAPPTATHTRLETMRAVVEARVHESAQGGTGTPAIIVPLSADSALTLTSPEQGVLFDIEGDGTVEQIAWTAPDSRLAFLAIDRNGNGLIDNGTELFGEATLPGVLTGFRAIQEIEPQDAITGITDIRDSVYAKLLLWEDRNHNGLSEPDELRPASEIVSAIGTGWQLHKRRDGHGNLFRYRSWAEVRTAPGLNPSTNFREHRERMIDTYEVFLLVRR